MTEHAQFPFGRIAEQLAQEIHNVSQEMQRPSVLLRPKLSLDGNAWCVLLGDNLMEGLAAFGKTPDEAMRNFDVAYYKQEARP